jgi:hypothetical protein
MHQSCQIMNMIDNIIMVALDGGIIVISCVRTTSWIHWIIHNIICIVQ